MERPKSGAEVLGEMLGSALAEAILSDNEEDEFAMEVQDRLGHLTYMEIYEPIGCYGIIDNFTYLYGEAVATYLLGYENASVPMSFRCLEIALKEKYRETEGTDPGPNMSAYELIEHFEDDFDNGTRLLHWFRDLRNQIHTTQLVDEQDALEALRHISSALNQLHPYEIPIFQGHKACCGQEYSVSVSKESVYLGNIINIRCDTCNQITEHRVLPGNVRY